MSELKVDPWCEDDYEVFVGESLPQEYREASDEELDRRIGEAKKSLGEKVVILGHHYQRDSIIKYADFRGDSLKLSQLAASRRQAQHIVFCGVHFMAEAADILSGDNQIVILPNLEAGCSMADMANIGQVETCWEELEETGLAEQIVPVTYINSGADLKAFVGDHGGAVCTSSNAPKILKWAFERAAKVLFFPDQHLGRITALDMGIPLDQMCVWDPEQPVGGVNEKTIRQSRVLLWKGYCSVHLRFQVKQIEQARREYPGIKVIVHPECSLDVVQAADEYGSTEKIVNTIRNAPSGSKWAVGTEINLVNRLAEEMPEKTIFCLDPLVCPCATMYQIHPAYLCWVLEELVKGRVVNQILVPDEIKKSASLALERMMQITG